MLKSLLIYGELFMIFTLRLLIFSFLSISVVNANQSEGKVISNEECNTCSPAPSNKSLSKNLNDIVQTKPIKDKLCKDCDLNEKTNVQNEEQRLSFSCVDCIYEEDAPKNIHFKNSRDKSFETSNFKELKKLLEELSTKNSSGKFIYRKQLVNTFFTKEDGSYFSDYFGSPQKNNSDAIQFIDQLINIAEEIFSDKKSFDEFKNGIFSSFWIDYTSSEIKQLKYYLQEYSNHFQKSFCTNNSFYEESPFSIFAGYEQNLNDIKNDAKKIAKINLSISCK